MKLRVSITLFSSLLVLFGQSQAEPPPANVHTFLQKHCIECHGAKEQKGDVRLDTLEAKFGEKPIADVWLDVMDAINKGDMPPKKVKVRPTTREFEPVTEWIADQLRLADAARRSTGGHVVLRRLNKTEYRNTVRDLFGFTELPLFDLPDDTPMNGFYNIGAALTVSPSHLEQYVSASQNILDKAIVTGERPEDASETLLGTELKSDKEAARNKGASVGPIYNAVYAVKDGAAHLYQSGIQFRRVAIPSEGEYLVQVRLARTEGFKSNPRFSIGDKKGGALVLQGEVTASLDKPQTFERRLTMRSGEQSFSFKWDEGARNLKKDSDVPAGTPALVFYEFDIKGPLFDAWPPQSHQRVFFKGDAAVKDANYARELLSRFVARMYRRPLQADELTQLIKMFDSEKGSGASFEDAVKFALQYALCSSPFLYLVEGASEVKPDKEGRIALNPWELAARLSYFLWSSCPDEELFRAAAAGELQDAKMLARQAQRMLADPRAHALADGFCAQWLELSKLGTFAPDKRTYPKFDSALDAAMREEPKAFFMELLRANRPLTDFIHCDWAMLNARLADHYGVEGVSGEAFQRVALKPEHHRGGLLGQAALLTLTADGQRTKPVTRGKYLLENILGTPPPPPPPGVGEFEPVIPGATKLTVRARLEKHRENETCAACHAKIDPIGFALENYGAIGAWRTTDKTAPGKGNAPAIDASGALPDGRKFAGIDDFKTMLLKDEDKFLHCLTEKLFTYATGRVVEFSDRQAIATLVTRAKQQRTLAALITDIISTPAFQTK